MKSSKFKRLFLSSLALVMSCTSVTPSISINALAVETESETVLDEDFIRRQAESPTESFETSLNFFNEESETKNQVETDFKSETVLTTENESSNVVDTENGESVADSESKETKAETSLETESESSIESSKESETETKHETESNTESSKESETETKHETESETNTETESKTETESESEAESKGGYNYVELDEEVIQKYLEKEGMAISGLPSFITNDMVEAALISQRDNEYPASVTVAQIILESGFGKYGNGGNSNNGLSLLSYKYNNMFNIKGEEGGKDTVYIQLGNGITEEHDDVSAESFRIYSSYVECVKDRDKIIKDYFSTPLVMSSESFAMKLGSKWESGLDVKEAFLQVINRTDRPGIRKIEKGKEFDYRMVAVTDNDMKDLTSHYGAMLIHIMDEYDLYRLDGMTLREFEAAKQGFANPCPGSVLTDDFGYRGFVTAGATTWHAGIDLGTFGNVPTYAVADGVVVIANYSSSAGNWIVIDHGDGMVTKYMHHQALHVKAGDVVKKGQQIGTSGTTGISTGNHLHFQIEINGVAVDPFQFLDRSLF